LNSVLPAWNAGALPLETHLQSILPWLFWIWGVDLKNYLSRLALNLDPHNLSIPSSEDYRGEPLAPDLYSFILKLDYLYNS
jgi:hypothetical protein